jgi:hypothetical protein
MNLLPGHSLDPISVIRFPLVPTVGSLSADVPSIANRRRDVPTIASRVVGFATVTT